MPQLRFEGKSHKITADRDHTDECTAAQERFQQLKRERIKRRIYVTREDARSDVFDYIEMFDNTRRQHGHNDGLSPVEFEKQPSK